MQTLQGLKYIVNKIDQEKENTISDNHYNNHNFTSTVLLECKLNKDNVTPYLSHIQGNHAMYKISSMDRVIP